MEPKEFELQQQHEPEEAQLFIKYANKVNGEQKILNSPEPALVKTCRLCKNLDGSVILVIVVTVAQTGIHLFTVSSLMQYLYIYFRYSSSNIRR